MAEAFYATGPIYFGEALAYAPGDLVPAENVTAHDYLQQGLVRAVDVPGRPAPSAGGRSLFLPIPTVLTKGTSYRMRPQDGIVLASGTVTVTLPAVAAAPTGVRFTVKNTGSGVVTVAARPNTVDGVASVDLPANGSVDAVTDGTAWFTV